jgi:hypothetical protein
MRLITVATSLAALSLAACNTGSGDGGASQRAEDASGKVPATSATTGAAGAVTTAADPNPTGSGATTGATPGDPSGAMGATSPTPTSPAPADPTIRAEGSAPAPTPAPK